MSEQDRILNSMLNTPKNEEAQKTLDRGRAIINAMSEQKTEFERSVAIREGHKIHNETSYFTPRPQLDFENARHVFGEGFDRGYIAATAEANKRMAELENDLINLGKENADLSFKNDVLEGEVAELNRKYAERDLRFRSCDAYAKELQANNHDLRKALDVMIGVCNQYGIPCDIAEALSAKPAESLAKRDDEVKGK